MAGSVTQIPQGTKVQFISGITPPSNIDNSDGKFALDLGRSGDTDEAPEIYIGYQGFKKNS